MDGTSAGDDELRVTEPTNHRAVMLTQRPSLSGLHRSNHTSHAHAGLPNVVPPPPHRPMPRNAAKPTHKFYPRSDRTPARVAAANAAAAAAAAVVTMKCHFCDAEFSARADAAAAASVTNSASPAAASSIQPRCPGCVQLARLAFRRQLQQKQQSKDTAAAH